MRLFPILALILFAATTSCGAPAFAAEAPTTTAQVLNHAIDKVSDAVAQVSHAVSEKAPKAWELLVRATFAKGLVQLIVGAIELLTAVAVFSVFVALARTDWEDPSLRNCAAIACALGAAVLFIGGLVDVLSNDAWFRVISPDGYLAQAILTKALGQ